MASVRIPQENLSFKIPKTQSIEIPVLKVAEFVLFGSYALRKEISRSCLAISKLLGTLSNLKIYIGSFHSGWENG